MYRASFHLKFDEPDLKYTSEYHFNEGYDAYIKDPFNPNPYPNWRDKEQHDWQMGYIYAQRKSLKSALSKGMSECR